MFWLITNLLFSLFLRRHPILLVQFLYHVHQHPHHRTFTGTYLLPAPSHETYLTTWCFQIDFIGLGSGSEYPMSILMKPCLIPHFLLHSTEVVLRSILTCRLMVGIREASQSFGNESDTFELSGPPRDDTLEFARRSLGESTSMDLEACAGPSKA